LKKTGRVPESPEGAAKILLSFKERRKSCVRLPRWEKKPTFGVFLSQNSGEKMPLPYRQATKRNFFSYEAFHWCQLAKKPISK
jgi:hypothetical protein